MVYLDKAFFGSKAAGYAASMKRAVRGHPLGIRDLLRNRRINKKRAPGERHYAVIKCVFKAGHVLVTTVERVKIKMLFTAFSTASAYIPAMRGYRGLKLIAQSRWWDLNPRPADYESAAPPLSHSGIHYLVSKVPQYL